MYAVIKTGGKQYKVAQNDVIKVEKLDGNEGATIIFDEVLLFGDSGKVTVGDPVVKDIKVSAEILQQKKDDKVVVFKKKRRHNYRRKVGHRQEITVVRIQDIGKDLKAKAAPAKKQEAATTPKAKEEAKKAAAPKKAETKEAPKAEKKETAAKKPAEKKETKKSTAATSKATKKED